MKASLLSPSLEACVCERERKRESLKNLGVYIEKKLKLGRDHHVDAPLRKILKHQTEVDNNP